MVMQKGKAPIPLLSASQLSSPALEVQHFCLLLLGSCYHDPYNKVFLEQVKKYFLSTAVSGTFICICLLFLHADMQISRAPEQISIQNCSCQCLRSSRAPVTLCTVLFLQNKLELMPYQDKSSAAEEFQNSKHLKKLIQQLPRISQSLQKDWRKPTETRQQH